MTSVSDFDATAHKIAGAAAQQADAELGEYVQHGRLYEVEHWRAYTGKHYASTTYGYEPETPPLTVEEYRKLPSSSYKAVVGAMAGGLAGERIALECSAALCSYAPDKNSQMFLATQVIDEARHVEVFTQRLKSLGRHDIEPTLKKFVSPLMFTFHDKMRKRVVDAKDFAGGIIGQNLALEGLALGFFEFHAALVEPIDPGTARILETVLHDERRHVGFGIVKLKEYLQESDENRAYVEDTMFELGEDMMTIFRENASRMADIGLDASAAMQRVERYHTSHLRQLGLTHRSASEKPPTSAANSHEMH